MQTINWKARLLSPWLNVLLYSVVTFLALLIIVVALCAFAAFVLGWGDPKWGDRWGNFGASLAIFSLVPVIQTGVVFVVGTVLALVRGEFHMRWAFMSTAALCALDLCLIPILSRYGTLPLWLGSIFACPVAASFFLLAPLFSKRVKRKESSTRLDELEFLRLCRQRLNSLRLTPFEELTSLDQSSEHVSLGRRMATLTVVSNTIDETTVQVIVKGYLPVRFFPLIRYAYADGFEKQRNGSVRQVEKQHL